MWPLFISFKYLMIKRKEGMISLTRSISALGVAVGVASLIIVLAIMNGFDKEIKKKIMGTYAHVIVLKEGGITEPEELISTIESTPGVLSVSGFVTGQAILKKKNTVTGILLKGIDPGKESKVTKVVEYTGTSGSELTDDTIILGKELLKNEQISIGDEVEILIPHSELDLEKTKLEVVGTFNSGRYDYDANIAIVDIRTAQKLFRMDKAITGVGIKTKDGMRAGDVKLLLQQILKYPYAVKSWMDLDRNLMTALATEKKMMFIILALIVMVACFNIAGSLIMLVMEKTKDIGILKALGANARGINIIFLLEGSIIGLMGIIAGGLAGVFVAERVNVISDLIERITGVAVFPSDVYYFTKIPVSVSLSDVATIVSVAFGLTLIAGFYPAWKASGMDPVEAIRYE